MMAASQAVLTTNNVFRNILSCFPSKCRYAFAYGSGVFQQKDQNKGKMIDIVFVVDDPVEWHTLNMKDHFDHYSGLRRLGPKWISYIQENMAAGVYYNPFVEVGGSLIKYGVVSTAALEADLTKWSHLYLAGRLQKPVLEIISDISVANDNIPNLIEKNRLAALRAALLLNSRSLKKTDLYYTITELSYLGDFRMAIGEHPDKVRNIVTPMVPQFDEVYIPLFEQLKPFVKLDPNGVITQDLGASGLLFQLMGLPYPIQRSLARKVYRNPQTSDIEEALVELAHRPHVAPYLRRTIAEIVWTSSILQTLQGVLSAGVVRSVKYGWEKISKKLKAQPSFISFPSPPPVPGMKSDIAPPHLSSEATKQVKVLIESDGRRNEPQSNAAKDVEKEGAETDTSGFEKSSEKGEQVVPPQLTIENETESSAKAKLSEPTSAARPEIQEKKSVKA